MTNTYKQRRNARMLQRSPVPPMPPRTRPMRFQKIQIIRLWHIRNSNSLIYLWRNKFNKIIRTRGYNYNFTQRDPEKPRIMIRDLARPAPASPRPLQNLVKSAMDLINDTSSARVKRALDVGRKAPKSATVK